MSERRGDLRGFLCWVFIPLLAVIVASLAVFTVTGDAKTATVISQLGTLGVLVVAMAYVVFFNSKRRWPNASAFQRFANAVTFRRD